MSPTEAAIRACRFSDYYAKMFETLEKPSVLEYQEDGRALSKALFYQLAKIKYAGWRHKDQFSRGIKHSVADIFQDLLAFYLRCALDSKQYGVVLEKTGAVGKVNKSRPDIVIQKLVAAEGGQAEPVNIFVIEVKTTTGWNRLNTQKDEDACTARLKLVAETHHVREQNVIYVYEEPSNNGRGFEPRYWKKTAMAAPDGFSRQALVAPYSSIYPLFFGTDPVTWKDLKRGSCPEIPEERFLEEAERRIVTPLEEVIALIKVAQPKP